MIKKIIIQGLIIILIFFTMWFALSKINWVGLFQIDKISDNTEKKLGEIYWGFFKSTNTEIKDPIIISRIQRMLSFICEKNNIDKESIKLHILESNTVNAFALPDGHLVLYSALISEAQNQEELAGVLSHELAHIQLKHIMKKLVKEVGLSLIVSVTVGQGGNEIIRETSRMISSTAFDRDWEKEADIKGVDYLVEANLNPKPFANFLYRLSLAGENELSLLTWVSTHPDSKDRANYILEYSKTKNISFNKILSEYEWDEIQNYFSLFENEESEN